MNAQNLMGFKFKMNKKSQSQIITAVLLILIVIGLAVIILNFSTNFVKDKLDSTGCFDIVDKVNFIESNKYTCYRNGEMLLKVHLGDIENSTTGFLIEIGGASTKSIKITNGAIISGVKMYSAEVNNDPAILVLPKKNEERTYIITVSDTPESVKINPIINDEQVCEASDILESIVLCK